MRFFRPIDSKAGISGTAAGALEIFPAVFFALCRRKETEGSRFYPGSQESRRSCPDGKSTHRSLRASK